MSLVPYVQGSAEWHALRARHCGASEVSALFFCEPAYALSKFALWCVKAGRADPPPVDNPRVEWGLRLEAAIAEAAADKQGWTIQKGGYASDPLCPGLGASLDYVIDPMPGRAEFVGPGALEVKSVDWLVHRRSWSNGEPPTHILVQLMAQLAATGFQWGAVAGLVGGNDLQVYTYQARPRVIAAIRKEVAAFWQSIREDRPPPPDGSEGARAIIQAMFPVGGHYDPVDLSADNELPDLCAQWQQATADKKEAEARVDLLRNLIMAKVGSNRHAIAQGFNITISTTEAKPDQPAPPGYVIKGRAEARRLLVKERRAA